jgi:hypothetical protein
MDAHSTRPSPSLTRSQPKKSPSAKLSDDALAPFLRVAKGIPRNWPGGNILRFDQRSDGSIFLGYHGINDASEGITIDEWRALIQHNQ